MAIEMASRIQDDFSSNRPHLLCVGTARRSLHGLQTDGPNFRADLPPPIHIRKRSALIVCRNRQPCGRNIFAACGQLKRTAEG
jgi:hypothetical protein